MLETLPSIIIFALCFTLIASGYKPQILIRYESILILRNLQSNKHLSDILLRTWCSVNYTLKRFEKISEDMNDYAKNGSEKEPKEVLNDFILKLKN